MIDAKVVITTETGERTYNIRVMDAEAGADAERKVRKVLGAGLEMGIALLDADFMSNEEGESV